MFNVTRKVSFSVAIALTVGWGIFFLLFLASSRIAFESQNPVDQVLVLPPGVKLSVQIDKRVYKSGDEVLIAVRNDSRYPIWIQQTTDGCRPTWWMIEQLQNDGDTWTPLKLAKQACTNLSLTTFDKHSLKTDIWASLVPGPQIGNVLVNAPSGTYRVVVPYVKGSKTTDLTAWPTTGIDKATSPQFSLQ